MPFRQTRMKLAYLTDRCSASVVHELCRAFREAAAPLCQLATMPQGMWAGFSLDVAYCVMRHRHWSAAPIFQDILVEFLTREYRIERAISESITAAMIGALCQAGFEAKSHIPATDKEFLRCIFVATAAARDEEALVADLGLGTHILKRIRQSVTSLVSQGGAANEVSFIPEIDELFSIIMIELSRELRQKPWATDVLRLNYLLMGVGEPWRTLLQDSGPTWLFEMLLTLGTQRGLKASALTPQLEPQLEGLTSEARGEAVNDLLETLQQLDLVYPEYGGGNTIAPYWHLSRLAAELTADAHYHLHLKSKRLTPTAILALSPEYQASAVRQLPERYTQMLTALVKGEPKPLGPMALSEALHRLSQGEQAIDLLEITTYLLDHDLSPWRREVALRHAARCTETRLVGQILTKVAQSDPSQAVRDTALELILHRPRLTPRDGGSASPEMETNDELSRDPHRT